MKNRFVRFGGISLVVLMSLSVVSAQERQPPPDNVMIYKFDQERMMKDHPPMPPGGDFVFFGSEMNFGGKLVKGAPYSAEAITENTQTLSDGNRIVNKSTASVYRDSEGRTRRDQSLRAIGPFANGGKPAQIIHISDPVAAVSYVLDPSAQTARKMPPMRFKFDFKTPPPDGLAGGPDAKGAFQIELHSAGVVDEIELHSAGVVDKKMKSGVAMGWVDKNNQNSQTESLGKQNIGGVEAEGTKTTVTIPAGEIGNERPIEIVSERWYSPELQIVVMTKHIDPRFGENTYRLVNIDRTEPARSLFEVPAGYKIEGPMSVPGQKMRTRKPAGEQ
ncbi:MAG: hypothetical protein ND895_18100 [Pyrinomonadaceae bacterium]|nr:hypothetical protein [Pyrinomonadaceae bacterium]